MAEVAWYKMEENAANTTVVDNANNSLTGTSQVNTSLMTIAGKVGQAFDFDGAADRVDVSDNALFRFANTGWTVAYWANQDASQTAIHVAKSDIGTQGFVVSSAVTTNRVNVTIGDGDSIATFGSDNSFLVDATWVHVVVTYTRLDSGALITWYKNGAFHKQTTLTEAQVMVDDATRNFVFGASTTQTLDYNGQLDDLRVYNRPLTLEEASFLYNSDSGTAVPLDGDVVQHMNVSANGVSVDGATASGAPTGTDHNKQSVAVAIGNNIKVLTLNRPATSPA